MPRRQRRPRGDRWAQLRRLVWERDRGRCQGPYCRDTGPIPLEQAHIDHRLPISAGGSNELANLRVLCRRCHVLRVGRAHEGMIAAALRDGVIPPDWRALAWSDEAKAED